jgi:phosphohistidine phosphatase
MAGYAIKSPLSISLDKTMKTLYLMRHAKSSWKDPDLDDSDRPLNKRGKRDAPFMGKTLKKREVVPDLIVSSPAKRARKTAEAVAREIRYPETKIVWEERLYASDSASVLNVIRELDDEIQRAMLFGHNPSFLDAANLIACGEISRLPTAAVVGIELDLDSWKHISAKSGKLILFEYPKKYQK